MGPGTIPRPLIRQRPSPNFGPRRNGLTPHFVVLHHTAMASAEAAIQRLSDPDTEVSAHYVICKSGDITQLVPDDMRAWHAGHGEWFGQQDMNSRSIGIELDNDGQTPFTFPLMESLEALLADLLAHHKIPPDNVIAHSDLAPGRKHDPGPWFDWVRLEAAGLARPRGTQSTKETPAEHRFLTLARNAGYTAPVPFDTLLSAVRLRYRSFATGPLSAKDIIPLTPPDPSSSL